MCLTHAIQSGEKYAIFLEDDARLSNASHLCDEAARKPFLESIPEDAFLVMLGGHRWKWSERRVGSFRGSVHSFGSYGFTVPRENLRALRTTFVESLGSRGDMIGPDVEWYSSSKKHGKHVFAHDPLLVRHNEGYSKTWNSTRGGLRAGSLDE